MLFVVCTDERNDAHPLVVRPEPISVVTAGFILVYLHRLLDDDHASPGRMPDLWRRLATTIGVPFVSVMLAILVVYEILALVRGELPHNMLSPLIMAAGFVGFLSTLIISAVLGEDTDGALQPAEPHRWARRRGIRLARAISVENGEISTRETQIGMRVSSSVGHDTRSAVRSAGPP